jgi:hypothetical protein
LSGKKKNQGTKKEKYPCHQPPEIKWSNALIIKKKTEGQNDE